MSDMSTAPTDGTWIIGIDKDGREARIQRRKTHPLLDHYHWAEGEVAETRDWDTSKVFYPVSWRPDAR